MTEIRISKQNMLFFLCRLFVSLEDWNFEFVSNFDIRISSLGMLF